MDERTVAQLRMLSTEFTRKGKNAARDARRAGDRFGRRMVAAVRQHASGRPGPERVTDEYYNSIGYETSYTRGGLATVSVGSDAPQMMRLENGFVGQDSLGRVYEQPPYPHFRPAADEMEATYEEYMAQVVDFDIIGEGL